MIANVRIARSVGLVRLQPGNHRIVLYVERRERLADARRRFGDERIEQPEIVARPEKRDGPKNGTERIIGTRARAEQIPLKKRGSFDNGE